jgi:hypothetical protein
MINFKPSKTEAARAVKEHLARQSRQPVHRTPVPGGSLALVHSQYLGEELFAPWKPGSNWAPITCCSPHFRHFISTQVWEWEV